MAFIKNELNHNVRVFNSFIDAQKVFEDFNEEQSTRIDALDYILGHKEIYYILEMLHKNYASDIHKDHPLIDYAFANFHTKPTREKDFDLLYKILQSQNAYLRNKVITFLQHYGKDAEAFIKRLIASNSRDLKIFAINILGDVSYESSRTILCELIKKEEDINVLMTAIDYMGEIGDIADISLLQEIKKKFSDQPYVLFGIDLAVDKIEVK